MINNPKSKNVPLPTIEKPVSTSNASPDQSINQVQSSETQAEKKTQEVLNVLSGAQSTSSENSENGNLAKMNKVDFYLKVRGILIIKII